jgi:hypothetical protein
MSDLKDVKSGEDAAIWARRILPAKNALNSADARQIEDAFEARLAVVQDASGEPDGHAPARLNHGTGTGIHPRARPGKHR